MGCGRIGQVHARSIGVLKEARIVAVADALSAAAQALAASTSAEMRAFVATALGGVAPEPGIPDGLRPQMLADAATKSREGGQPVDLTAL